MIFTEIPLSGAFLIEPEPIIDSRGFFARLFSSEALAERGLATHFPQVSMSHNNRKGIVRGLHLQRPPHAEVKLVRVTAGAIHDVIVDVRAGSATYGRAFAVELSASNRLQLYVPAGFAHGFQTLTETADVVYHISEPFVPELQDGIRWNDSDLAIGWPDPARAHVSPRDAALKAFAEFAPVSIPL